MSIVMKRKIPGKKQQTPGRKKRPNTGKKNAPNSRAVAKQKPPKKTGFSKKSIEEKRAEGIKPFPVVGIGGSAGGLEAFSNLLQHLPTDLGMAYVYIQH